MTLAGFRPALKSEYEEYEYHHRARIAMKPGITGMWQVSGRSDITDFEEVVKLDTEYIRNWSMAFLLIVLKIVCADIPVIFAVVIKVMSAMIIYFIVLCIMKQKFVVGIIQNIFVKRR